MRKKDVFSLPVAQRNISEQQTKARFYLDKIYNNT